MKKVTSYFLVVAMLGLSACTSDEASNKKKINQTSESQSEKMTPKKHLNKYLKNVFQERDLEQYYLPHVKDITVEKGQEVTLTVHTDYSKEKDQTDIQELSTEVIIYLNHEKLPKQYRVHKAILVNEKGEKLFEGEPILKPE